MSDVEQALHRFYAKQQKHDERVAKWGEVIRFVVWAAVFTVLGAGAMAWWDSVRGVCRL